MRCGHSGSNASQGSLGKDATWWHLPRLKLRMLRSTSCSIFSGWRGICLRLPLLCIGEMRQGHYRHVDLARTVRSWRMQTIRSCPQARMVWMTSFHFIVCCFHKTMLTPSPLSRQSTKAVRDKRLERRLRVRNRNMVHLTLRSRLRPPLRRVSQSKRLGSSASRRRCLRRRALPGWNTCSHPTAFSW